MAAAVGAEPLPHLAALWPSGSKCRPRSPWGFWKWQLWYSPIFSSNFCHPSVLNLTFKSSDKLSPFLFHFFSHIQHFVLTWLHTQVTSSFTAAPFQALNSPPNFAKPVLFTVIFFWVTLFGTSVWHYPNSVTSMKVSIPTALQGQPCSDAFYFIRNPIKNN